jgi:hypothetical protein
LLTFAFAFPFLTTHAFRALCCLLARVAAAHLVGRANADFLPLACRLGTDGSTGADTPVATSGDVVLCTKEARARDRSVLATNTLASTMLTISRQIRTAGRRWARRINWGFLVVLDVPHRDAARQGSFLGAYRTPRSSL